MVQIAAGTGSVLAQSKFAETTGNFALYELLALWIDC
jgi:hypothetical protein